MFGQWMGDNRIDLELGNKEVSETFEDLKRNKEIIKNIDKDFFFKFGETVLNLIQTQQAEIEHQKEKRENQKKELSILNEKQKEFNKLRNTVNSYKGQFKRQQVEIEKKDKIIDEMATYIATLDIEEDICVKVGKENGCDQMAYGECEECIKKYFERKAKNE